MKTFICCLNTQLSFIVRPVKVNAHILCKFAEGTAFDTDNKDCYKYSCCHFGG